jgi:hypothetical protein
VITKVTCRASTVPIHSKLLHLLHCSVYAIRRYSLCYNRYITVYDVSLQHLLLAPAVAAVAAVGPGLGTSGSLGARATCSSSSSTGLVNHQRISSTNMPYVEQHIPSCATLVYRHPQGVHQRQQIDSCTCSCQILAIQLTAAAAAALTKAATERVSACASRCTRAGASPAVTE